MGKMMASLVSKRLRYESFCFENEYLVHVLRFSMQEDRGDLHKSIEPTVRDAGDGEQLERIYSVPQQKPHDRENDMVKKIYGKNNRVIHGHTVR